MNSGLYAPEGFAATACAAANANWFDGPLMKFSNVNSYRPLGRSFSSSFGFSVALPPSGAGAASTNFSSTSKPRIEANASLSRSA